MQTLTWVRHTEHAERSLKKSNDGPHPKSLDIGLNSSNWHEIEDVTKL